ncbi:MAG: efflux RND transporter permease subunit [Melioribacteraceae bacterium]|nr:efflux RND transporter permease subunit [Melioribacteraceae bacterium]MCF8264593.1 efflux RND transporter permease subunit [Melioribacteraceae bacterium]
MEKLIAFFIRYRVWNNVLLFSIFAFGFLMFSLMKYSFFPEIPPDILNIQVVYPGAAPEEVEEGVVLKIEEALDGLEGIERVTSSSRENFGVVNVEKFKEANMDEVLTDVKNSIDRINSFPQGMEKPVIFEQKFRTRALSIVLYGDANLYNIKYIAEQFRDNLLLTDEISQVTIQGIPNLEFSIEISEQDLRKYNLTFDEVSRAVASANVNISGGKFETLDEEILIRANGRKYFADELVGIVIRALPNGEKIFLSDIATITEQWEDVPNKSYFNGRTAAVLEVEKTEEEDILAVAEVTKNLIDEFNQTNSTVQAIVINDSTISLSERIELLVKNGLFGLVLVLLTLGFFLNLRLSFWVSLGIPFSFAGMFIVAFLSGITINVISLFGMIIVVGILVDDAIVVGENIYAHYENGEPPMLAALNGTKEMVGPVFTSIFTTVIAFMPFFFLDGFLGKFIWHMALVVIATLLFSLAEAFLILPGHLAHSKGLHPHKEDSKFRKRIEGFIDWITNSLYAPSLRYAMRHKWITLVIPISFVMVTIGLIKGGIIGVTFFPFIDGDTLPVNISLTAGKQEFETEEILKQIEKASWEVNEEIKEERVDGKDVVLDIKRDIGVNDLGESGSHTGRITLELLSGEERNMDSYLIANRIRDKIGPIPRVQNITYGRTSLFGKPISVSLLGNNLTQLDRAKELLFKELDNFSTLKDVTISSEEGPRELSIQLKPKAYALGLNLREVARQLRQGFFGDEVQRIQRGRDEIKVWVRYKEEDRAQLGALNQLRIRTASGSEYPFLELADYTIDRGIINIGRLNNRREVRVDANLASEELDVPPILEEIRETVVPRVLAQVQGVQVSFEGQSRAQEKIAKSMQQAFPIAIGAMFILVILVFRSYIQASLIFSLIPLAVIGAIWGHGIQGIQLNTLSIYGVIALAGIVINDSIVFVDKINRNLKNGMNIIDSVYDAGLTRLRPIILTTLTTTVGLAPLIFETSRQAQFLIPMAISVAYGLLFGTFVILFVLPSGFLVLNKMRYFYEVILLKKDGTYESVEPHVKELDHKF